MDFKKIKNEKGITLIALAVTIVVLLILAGVSLNAVFSQNGIISKAKDAQTKMGDAENSDLTAINNLNEEMENWINGTGNDDGATKNPVVVVENKEVTLTKDNVWQYLGKIVGNYKTNANSTETVTINEKAYIVSTRYRLYYVDFDGKYGEKNTIYLKADCTSNTYSLPNTDTTAATDTSVKIKNLNPALYAEGVTSPSASNDNMKTVTWLLNTTNWESLKDTNFSSKINYVVGAPSLEMMMDSYNTHYQLTGETPDTSTLDENSDRVKLFYQYPYTGDTNNYGYGVGPCNYGLAINGYYTWTSGYTVKTDSEIDSMYFPGTGNDYWLATPSAVGSYFTMYISSVNGGGIHDYSDYNSYALCPVVSLQSDAKLELTELAVY